MCLFYIVYNSNERFPSFPRERWLILSKDERKERRREYLLFPLYFTIGTYTHTHTDTHTHAKATRAILSATRGESKSHAGVIPIRSAQRGSYKRGISPESLYFATRERIERAGGKESERKTGRINSKLFGVGGRGGKKREDTIKEPESERERKRERKKFRR